MKQFLAYTLLTLFCCVAYAGVPSVAVYWQAPAVSSNNGPATSYNLYQSSGLLQPFVQIQTGLTGLSASVTRNVAVGSTPCFAIAAVNAGGEGVQSTPGCVTVIDNSKPTTVNVPGTPVNVTVAVVQHP